MVFSGIRGLEFGGGQNMTKNSIIIYIAADIGSMKLNAKYNIKVIGKGVVKDNITKVIGKIIVKFNSSRKSL